MSQPATHKTDLSHIHALADAFETDKPRVRKTYLNDIYFLNPNRDAFARRLGDLFWLPVERAYTIFLYAYSALFGIPAFTAEAVARQADRFSQKRLPLTIRSTTGFVLDGFGYDRRSERPRKDIYWPGPVIQSVHTEQKKTNKARISNPAMAYFGYHLIRAAEHLAPQTSNADRHDHFLYIGDFFRTAGYPFPKNRGQAADFSRQTDALLAGDQFADYWHNISHAAEELNVSLDTNDLAAFLPERTAIFFRKTIG